MTSSVVDFLILKEDNKVDRLPGLHSLQLRLPMRVAHQPPTLVMLDVCKCAAAWLDVPWPAAVAETSKSR